MRLGLCGLGSAALRAHIPALAGADDAGLATVVAVCDSDPQRCGEARERLPGARTYTDLEAMLEESALDVLVVATPPSAHLEAIRAALPRGVHVVCEKPLGLTEDDVAELRALTTAHPDTALATVLQYHHAPAWQQIARGLNEAIGLRLHTHVRMHVERPGTDPLSAGGWRAQPDREGGILGDHAVHYLGMLQRSVPGAAVLDCVCGGGGGRETAEITVSLAPRATATIRVTYAGARRRNVVQLSTRRARLRWEDDRLRGRVRAHTVGSLSDRDFVNRLYEPWYRSLLTDLHDPVLRTARTAESLAVAGLLATALTEARRPAAQPAWSQLNRSRYEDAPVVDGAFDTFARTVLLAFADLGIYLPSQRERLLSKMRALDPLEPEQIEEFLDLCIAAQLITPERAGRLLLAPIEARRLARSLEGHSPVPDDQALAWARQLNGSTA